MKNKIYLAGPLFTDAEQKFNQKLCDDLTDNGYEVFLPQRECAGKEGIDIFTTCKYGIDQADLIVAIVDGADADSGTCWECGYGYATNKDIIGVRTDFRKSGDTGGFNAMIFFSAFDTVEGNGFLTPLLDSLEKLKAGKPGKIFTKPLVKNT